MLNLIQCQGDGSQNHSELSPHACHEWLSWKRQGNKCWWGCDEKRTNLWRSKWRQVQPLWRLLEKIKNGFAYHRIEQFHFWVYTERKWKQEFSKVYAHSCLSQHCSQLPEHRYSPNAHQEWIKDTHTQWNIFQPWEKKYPPTCDIMDGPWTHYPKWDKSDRQRQVLYDDSTSLWNLKKLNV